MPVLELSAGLEATESGAKVAGWLRRWLRGRRETSRLARDAKRQLGILQPQLYVYRAATMHPLYQRGLPHPDNLSALVAISGDQYDAAASDGTVDTVANLTALLSDGMVLIGSPEEEGVSRLAFGYRVRDDGSGMEFTGSSVDLPFRWHEDRNTVHARCRKFVAGRGEVVRPNWPIIDERRTTRSLYPRVRNDGFLDSDLLLITKVPNFLTRIGYESGRSLVFIGGAHGTATRAIELLLQDRAVLSEVANQLPRDATAYQLVFDVADITHDSSQGSRAASIALRACAILDRPDIVWDSARRDVEQRYADWLTQAGQSGNSQ